MLKTSFNISFLVQRLQFCIGEYWKLAGFSIKHSFLKWPQSINLITHFLKFQIKISLREFTSIKPEKTITKIIPIVLLGETILKIRWIPSVKMLLQKTLCFISVFAHQFIVMDSHIYPFITFHNSITHGATIQSY
jgi:hypothetical protein